MQGSGVCPGRTLLAGICGQEVKGQAGAEGYGSLQSSTPKAAVALPGFARTGQSRRGNLRGVCSPEQARQVHLGNAVHIGVLSGRIAGIGFGLQLHNHGHKAR